jgi:hypothetical protein
MSQGGSPENERNAEANKRSADSNEHPSLGLSSVSHSDAPQIKSKESDYRDTSKRLTTTIYEHLPTAQAVSNIFIALFTGCLVFIGYTQQQPNVIINLTPIQNFVKAGMPKEMVLFRNIGQATAYSLTIGSTIAVLPYPLGKIHLTEIPPNTQPQDVYASDEIGRPVEFQYPLSDKEFATVSSGKDKLIYVWGTIQYSDFVGIRHTRNFCNAFGGVNLMEWGICSVERPHQSYVLEEEQSPQEPHAYPIPVPPPPASDWTP